MLKLFYSAALVFLMLGCTQKTTETNMHPRDSVWGEQVKALDKARSVEKTLHDAAERARAAETQR